MGMVSIFLNVHPYLEKDFEKKTGIIEWVSLQKHSV